MILGIRKTMNFRAFQVAPAGELYEQEFLSLVSSVESLSKHSLAKSILAVTKKNNTPVHPVIGYNEFPGKGVGGAVQLGKGNFRAVVIGNRGFLKQCGLDIPEILEVAIRRWEGEGANVVLGGWDGWVRGILKFTEA